MLASLATFLFLAALPISAAPPASATPAPDHSPAASSSPIPLPDWWGRINAGAPGDYPAPRSFQAAYRVTWEGVEAARFETQCSATDGTIGTTVSAHTTGAARVLWKFDVKHVSVVDRRTLKPLHLEQTEDAGRKHTFDRVDFTPTTAIRTSVDLKKEGEHPAAKIRRYDFPGLFDMESAFLYMRSLPLTVGETRTLALMTSGSPYLVTIRVVNRGRVQVAAGDYPAIEYALSLEKINKYGVLEPRKGFRSAEAWISDDADRLIIKAQAEVFIGAVTVEMESVSFKDGPTAH